MIEWLIGPACGSLAKNTKTRAFILTLPTTPFHSWLSQCRHKITFSNHKPFQIIFFFLLVVYTEYEKTNRFEFGEYEQETYLAANYWARQCCWFSNRVKRRDSTGEGPLGPVNFSRWSLSTSVFRTLSRMTPSSDQHDKIEATAPSTTKKKSI